MVRMVLWIVPAAAWLPATAAFGQSEPFTYQGQLKQQGIPLTGEVDLRFTLYDSDTADTPVAGPLVFDSQSANAAVSVANGLFSVELDFGVDALLQGGRWIQIEVRAPHDPLDIEPYTPLTPRQRITAAPLALGVPGLATTPAGGVEVLGDIHTPGEVIASAFSSNSPLIFKVNPANVECARFEEANCFFGLGTTLPQARLHIGGTPGVDGIMFPDGSLQTSAAGTGGGGGFWSASGLNIYNNNGGNVGIGTSNPGAKLDVATGEVRIPGGTNPPNYPTHFNYFGDGRNYIRGETILADTGGNVGIGTATPAFPLTIRTSASIFTSGYGWVHTNGTQQIGSYVSSGGGWLGTRSNDPLHFFTNDSSPQMTLATSGRLGIGTQAPICPLHAVSPTSGVSAVFGTAGSGTANAGVFGASTASNGNGIIGEAHNGGAAYGVWGRAANGIGGYFEGGSYALYANGRARVGVLEIAGADVAEKFPSSEATADPGTVMEIDPENPGHLRTSRSEYSTRVAGVVSGAGDLPVGAILGHLPGHEDAPAIALSGRVWVRCDASSAAIAPGDLLTTSATPGHAMKSADRERSHGAVLGKAMTSLARGERGLVLVLVNLQ